MKQLIYYCAVFLIATFIPKTGFSQQHAGSSLSDNAIPYKNQIVEVYGEEFFENTPQLVSFYQHLLGNRISYRQEVQQADEKYPLLTSFGFNNKLNQELLPLDPSNFNPDTFNPLTYGVGYTNLSTLIIRVDGTDYLMIVEPQF